MSSEIDLQLAPRGLAQCKGACNRVGPMNEAAFIVWWAGVPRNAICPDCFHVGRTVEVTRTVHGIDVILREASSEIIDASPGSADIGVAVESGCVQCEGPCGRVVRMNASGGAMATIWSMGRPVYALCQECMTMGRTIVAKRTLGGIAVRLLGADGASKLVLASEMPRVALDQTALHRKQWPGSMQP